MADCYSFTDRKVSVSVFNLVVIMTAILMLLDQATAKPQCQPGWYYDTVTGNCDHCSDICDGAAAMDTSMECDRKCPGYRRVGTHNEEKCPPHQYYDDTVGRCHLCDSLCLNAGVRGTEGDCKNLCPDWSVLKDESTEIRENSSLTTTPPEPSHQDIEQSPILYVNVTNILVAVFVLIVSLLVASLVTACIIWRIKGRNKLLNKACNKRPHQVQQMEYHELESLTGRGDPPSHPQNDEG